MSKKISIKSRLVAGLLLIVGLYVAQGAWTWYFIHDTRSTVVETTRKNTIAAAEIGELAILAQQIRRYEKEFFVYVNGDPQRRAQYLREWSEAHDKIGATLARIRGGSGGAFSTDDIAQAAVWQAASDFYGSEMKKIFVAVDQRAAEVRAAREGGAQPVAVGTPQQAAAMYTPAEVNDMIKPGKDRFSAELIKGVAAMDKSKAEETLSLAAKAAESFNRLLYGMLAALAVGVLVAVALSVSLPRIVTRTIDRLSSGAEDISMGKLDAPFDAGGIVEFDKLADALNRMRIATQLLVERLHNRTR